jgi:MATE family multidrug resistance protein
MINRFEAFKQELRPMLRLASPLVLANLGWMSMGIVDTMMVGRVSPEAIGAVSLGSILFSTVALFGGGILLGLDTLIPQAFGAGKVDDCHRTLLNSVYFSVPVAAALMGIVWLCVPFLRSFGINPAVLREAIPYLKALMWGMLPLLLYFAFRGYLQGMNLAKPVMFALITANLVNIAGNWVLIFGHLGAPAMGAVGSGWSTCISRMYMALALLVYILYYDRRHGTGLERTSLKPELARIRRLVGLGFPAAMQLTLEVGVFAAATALVAKLDPLSLAAHQIALNAASFTFMVPLGIGSAAAVRVGQALGRLDAHGASRSGWTALVLGAAFMSCAALVFLFLPKYIVRIFTPDPAVMNTGISLLRVAAFFQLFDGLQTVATGALRGAGDTRTPMICHLLAYWVLGLPLGYFLCFRWSWGASGLWIGLCVALIVIGLVLSIVWRRQVHLLSRTGVPAEALETREIKAGS